MSGTSVYDETPVDFFSSTFGTSGVWTFSSATASILSFVVGSAGMSLSMNFTSYDRAEFSSWAVSLFVLLPSSELFVADTVSGATSVSISVSIGVSFCTSKSCESPSFFIALSSSVVGV